MNPVDAPKDAKCVSCGEEIPEGDFMYLTDEGRMCEDCAEEHGYICKCGNFKKAVYPTCYDCK